MTSASPLSLPLQFSPIDLPLTVSAPLWMSFFLHQFVDHRRHAAGAMELLAEIFARRLQVDEQRHGVADLLPILDVEPHADMAGDRVDVDRRVGRAADRAVDDDRILERLARQNVGRLQILPHHLDDALAGRVGDLAALAIGAGNDRATGQTHAQRLGDRIHRRRGAHRVAMADRGADEVTISMNSS